jgi:hypothetical protein
MTATFFPLIASTASCPSIRERVLGCLGDGPLQKQPFQVWQGGPQQVTDLPSIQQLANRLPQGRVERELPWLERRLPASPFPQWQG